MYVSRGSVGMYPSLRPPPRSGVSRNGLCWGVTPVSICLALPGESLVGAFLSFNKSLWFKHWRFGQTPVLRHTLHFDSVQCWFSLIAPFRLKVSIELMHLCLVFCDYGWLSPKVYVELITINSITGTTLSCLIHYAAWFGESGRWYAGIRGGPRFASYGGSRGGVGGYLEGGGYVSLAQTPPPVMGQSGWIIHLCFNWNLNC